MTTVVMAPVTAIYYVSMALTLRHYTLADESPALAAHAALAAENFAFLLAHDAAAPWEDFVQMTRDNEFGKSLPPGFVPAAQLAADVDGELVGRTSIRFSFNDFLAYRGGHIGYAVCPQFRRRGYATEILRASLVIARNHGVERVLLTCDDTNIGSATVIENNGGVLEAVVEDPNDGVRFRRYWIA